MVLERLAFGGGDNNALPPHCPEAERGVLGCCLLDPSKTAAAMKAGVTPRWFYDLRHAELFNVLTMLALEGGGDLVTASIALRKRGKLEGIGGLPYLGELQNGVPSAENLDRSFQTSAPRCAARTSAW